MAFEEFLDDQLLEEEFRDIQIVLFYGPFRPFDSYFRVRSSPFDEHQNHEKNEDLKFKIS